MTPYRLIAPDPQEHLLPMGQLTADVFTAGQYVEQFCENYIGNSHYDWSVSRLVLDGDQFVHHWGVWGYQMRLESTVLEVGGIGAVATHADYRQQGLMHQAAEASFEAMRQAGYDLSILRGRHYVKMGYARAWNYVTLRFKPEDVAGLAPARPYLPLRPDQVGEMDALYNHTHARFTGTAIRPTFLNKHPDDIGTHAWFGPDGRLEGYIRAQPAEEDPKTLLCLEAAGDPRQGLAVLADLFKTGGYEKLACFTIPCRHPLAQLLRKGACTVEDRYFDTSGWRVKLINLESALQKMAPLFEKRLEESPFGGWQGCLVLDGGEQKAALHMRRGRVEVSAEGDSEHVLEAGPELARFLIGSDDAEEIMQQGDMRCGGLALPLVKTLFPNLHPMMSHWDEY